MFEIVLMVNGGASVEKLEEHDDEKQAKSEIKTFLNQINEKAYLEAIENEYSEQRARDYAEGYTAGFSKGLIEKMVWQGIVTYDKLASLFSYTMTVEEIITLAKSLNVYKPELNSFSEELCGPEWRWINGNYIRIGISYPDSKKDFISNALGKYFDESESLVDGAKKFLVTTIPRSVYEDFLTLLYNNEEEIDVVEE